MADSSLIPLSRINWKNIPFFLSFFIILINLSNINCKTCKESTALSETDCFNNIIEININSERYYRAGHFATNKNGDLIIEYSSDGTNLPQDYRLFYALKENGRGFFNDNYMKEKQLTKSGDYIGRYESRNIMIHLYENYSEEYVFSTSAYASVSELHDFENDKYLVADTDTFLGKRIFSYVYNIMEATEDGKTIYFIFYTTPEKNPGDNDGNFWAGFALGFLLGIIGFVIALCIGKRLVKSGSIVGFMIWSLVWLIFVVLRITGAF